MGQEYILDTNTVIYYLEGGILDLLGKTLVENAIADGARISVISKIELLSWNPPGESNLENLYTFVENSVVFGLDDAVVHNTIHLRKNHRKIKLPDAIIAATALFYNLNLITRNTSDFTFIKGIRITDPFNL